MARRLGKSVEMTEAVKRQDPSRLVDYDLERLNSLNECRSRESLYPASRTIL